MPRHVTKKIMQGRIKVLSPMEKLFKACEEGSLENIKLYLSEETKRYINIAMQKAIQYGHIEIVNFLVENGIDINSLWIDMDDKFTSPITEAVKYGHYSIVQFCIDKGAYVHINYNLPMYVAVKYGHIEIMKLLKLHGADIHYDDKKYIEQAAMHNHIDIVKYLINTEGDSPFAAKELGLKIASEYGHLDIVNFLVENGALIDHYDEFDERDSALAYAANKGHLDIIKYLLEKGADIHYADDNAFIRAIEGKQFNAAKLLIEKGANINAQNSAAIDWLITFQYTDSEYVKLLKLLIKNNASMIDEQKQEIDFERIDEYESD
jgi:ankyrin repeat protein